MTGLVDRLVDRPVDRLVALGRRTVHEVRESDEDLAHRLFGELTPRQVATLVRTLEETTSRFAALMEEST